MSGEPQDLPTIAEVRAAAKRIRDDVVATPTVPAPDLGEDLGQPLWLKMENLQRTGSFKARGALNWIRTADEAELRNGLITVSAGNHAIALAWAARQASAAVTVVMPKGSSELKIAETERYGAKVIVHGTIQEAVAHTHELRVRDDLTLVHPYNDPRVMAGQGTIGLEILDAVPDMARVLCPIGGGGLISGIGIALKAVRPDVELIGVEPAGAATMRNAWDRNDPTAALSEVRTIASSLAPAIVGPYTYAISRRVVDGIVTVDEDSIRDATRRLIGRGRVYIETGCSVGLAALLSARVPVSGDRATVLILTGGNMDPDQAAELLATPR